MKKLRRNGEKMRVLPVEKLLPGPWQVRREEKRESRERLAESLTRYGMLQPITARPVGKEFEVILGNRRLEAARLLNWETVPCVIIKLNSRKAAETVLGEHFVKGDLDFFEEADLAERLFRTFRYTRAELAERIGVSADELSLKFRILRFSPEERLLFRENALGERIAFSLLRLPDTESRLKALRRIISEGMSELRARELVEEMLEEPTSAHPCAAEPRPRILPLRKGAPRDAGLLTNSVDRALMGFRSAGVPVESEKKEEEDCISYSIRIPKAAL